MSSVARENSVRIRIQSPEIRSSEEERLWQEILKYSKLIPSEPEPNMGRVQEIREELANGSYLSRDKIDETAARLVIRFMKKE